MFIPHLLGHLQHSLSQLCFRCPSQACTRSHKEKIIQWFQDKVHLSL